MKKSIYDIARMAGVSTATVSRVINSTGITSDSARNAVLRAISEAKYVPRGSPRNSRSLVEPKIAGSMTIELVFCFSRGGERLRIDGGGIEAQELENIPAEEFMTASSSFYRPIGDGAVDEARKFGYRTVMRYVRKDALDNPGLLSSIYEDGSCGLLLAGEQPEGLSRFLEDFKLPVVLVDIMAGTAAVEVTTDNFEGISQAFEHVYSLGHRRIGFLIGDDSLPAYRERFTAFSCKMAERGLEIRNEWIYRGTNHLTDSAEWGMKLLRHGKTPTAFLSTNDYCALGLMRAAIKSGVKVPRDLSIVGFDDMETSNLVTPSLTSVNVPKSEIGRCAARELVVSLRNGKRKADAPRCRVRIMPTLVKRESTTAPKK